MKSTTLFITLVSAICFGQEPINEVIPQYPESPICRDEAGEIVLSYFILENGKPHKIEVISTDSPRFIRQAITALTKYEFKKGTYRTTFKYHKSFTFKAERECNSNA